MPVGKSMDDILAEAKRRARERMGLPPEEKDGSMTEQGALATAPGTVSTPQQSRAPLPKECDFLPGETLAEGYRISSEAIRGGMGSVWKIYHNGWNTDLAMKRPQAKFFDSEKSKETFIHECKAWIGLGLHPNIVSCYYVQDIEGVPSIFAEWMPNGSLKDHIRDGSLYSGTEPEQQERLLDIAIQFARGLHYAHERNLIHQDVKPDNLLLTDSWDAKVADFGLARACSYLTVMEGSATERELPDPESTTVAPTGGYTLAYASPEQLNSQLLTRRTDIYSWAVSVMETYLGERLWMSGNAAGEACRGYFGRCRVPMPERLQELLAQCMAREPDERPHDFAVVLQELTVIFKAVTGKEYPYPSFETAKESADSLSNKALSFLQLGKDQEAEELFKAAVEENGTNPTARYNYTLFLFRHGKISADDAIVLMKENWQTNWNSPDDYAFRLYGKMIYEIGGENEVHSKMYFFFERGAEEEHILESMLKDGSIRSDYVLCRIRDLRSYQRQEGRYRRAVREVESFLAEGDIRAASASVERAECDPLFADCLNRSEWLELTDRVRARCFRLNRSRTWTKEIIPGIPSTEKLSFSEDGSLLLCGERLYDVKTGRCLGDHTNAEQPRLCSSISPDGAFYLRACEDGFDLIRARTGEVLSHYAHPGEIWTLVYSPDGRYAVSAGEMPFVNITDIKSGQKRSYLIPGGHIHRVLVRYDNRELILQTEEGILAFDTVACTPQMIYKTDPEHCVWIAADARFKTLLLTIPRTSFISDRPGVLICDRNSGRGMIYDGKDDRGNSLVFVDSPTKAEFAGNGVHIHYTVASGLYTFSHEKDKLLDVVRTQKNIDDAIVSRDGKYAAILSDGKIYLQRRVDDFVYADPDGTVNSAAYEEYLNTVAESLAVTQDYTTAEIAAELRRDRDFYISAGRRDALEEENLLPYAYIWAARYPGKNSLSLLFPFLGELESRGMGYISKKKAMSVMDTALAAVKRDNGS